jgi:hypothetical protein
MKLLIHALTLALSSLFLILPTDAVDRDLTIACGLDLNDCQAALSAAENRCERNPAPMAPTPTPPTAPVAPGTLSITGDNNVPPEAFPMNMCEGDCDEDSDCRGNLVCYQRDDVDTALIPGCSGIPDVDGSDYCCDTSFEGCVSSEGGGDPTGGFPGIIGQILASLDPIFDLFDVLLGLNSRRRNLREDSSVDGSERKLLFGLIGRECRALLERCERKLAEFSCQPTVAPSSSPTLSPTKSAMPSPGPNPVPSQEPTITPKPTKAPTKRPTKRPTKAPTARPVRPPTAAPVAQKMGKRRRD